MKPQWLRRIQILGIGIFIFDLLLYSGVIASTLNNGLFDLWRSLKDLQLQLFLIGLALLILMAGAYLTNLYSLRIEKTTVQKTRLKKPSLLRLKRYGSWQKRNKRQLTSQTHNQDSDVSFWQGISTELWGAVITTIFLGFGLLVFEQYQTLQNRKDELILQLRSPSSEVSVEAARILYNEGWVYDGSLRGVYLEAANLQGALLDHADLQGASLQWANLERASFIQANFEEASLTNANLRGTIFAGANLRGADLSNAIFNNLTVLPDSEVVTITQGTEEFVSYNYKYWSSETDMSRYTDSNHPDFWQPTDEQN
jgi:uncharacterized protein YjbI with pentapeptide repeats